MASLIAFARVPVKPNQIGYNRKLRLFASFNLIQHETSQTLGKFWEDGKKNFQGNKDEIFSSRYLPPACMIYHNLVHITKAMLTVCRAFEGGPSRISKNEDIDQDLRMSGKSESHHLYSCFGRKNIHFEIFFRKQLQENMGGVATGKA